MIRPNEEGHRANGAPKDQLQYQHSDFACDDGAGKALATMQARVDPAGLSPPHKDEPPGVQAEGFKGKGTTDTQIFADIDAGRKSFVTLQARYALAGFALLELADGTLLATRWNCSKPLSDLYAAHRFLRQVTGSAA